MSRIEETKHYQQLDKEIEEMERAVSGKPSSSPEVEEADTAEVEQDGVEKNEGHTEEETVLVSSGEEPSTTSPESTNKRTSWKQEYQELEKRYRKLRASTDAKLYQLRTEKSDLLSRINKLEDQIDTLSVKLATNVETKVEDYSDLFSEDEVSLMGGDEYLKSLSKIANKLVDKKVKPLEQKLEEERKEKRRQMKEAEERSRKENYRTFLSRLEEKVPNYKAINVNQDFLRWLDGFDSDSGYSRLERLRAAQQSGDVPQVASFFIRWKRESQEETNPILENKVSPRSTQQGVINTKPKGVEIIPFSVISKFYDDDAKGKYRNNQKKANELEKKYDIARMEGRIDFRR